MVAAGGERLATLDGESIHLWSLPTLEPIAQIDDVNLLEFNHGVVLSRDGRDIAILDQGYSLWRWREGSGAPATRLAIPSRYAPRQLIGFTPDNHPLWISFSGEIILQSAQTFSVVGRTRSDRGVKIDGDPQKGYLIWSGKRHQLHAQWLRFPKGSAISLAELPSFWSFPEVKGPFVSDASHQLITVLNDQRLISLDTQREVQLEPVDVGRGGDHASMIHLSPDGDWLLVVYDSGLIQWRSARDGRLNASSRFPARLSRDVHPRRVRGLQFSDPETLWVLLPEQRLLRYDTRTRHISGDWSL